MYLSAAIIGTCVGIIVAVLQERVRRWRAGHLAEILRGHRVAFNAGQPTATDDEYDRLECWLRSIDPENPFLSEIGEPEVVLPYDYDYNERP